MRRGFSLLELTVAIAVMTIMTTVYVAGIKPFFDRKKKEETLDRFVKLKQALSLHYQVVVDYRRNHPDWVSQSDCSRDKSWIIPPGCWSSSAYSQTLVLWKDPNTGQTPPAVLQAFLDAGCYVVNNGIGTYIRCRDAWGDDLKFTYVNPDNTHSAPYDYKSPVSITVTSAGKDGKFGTSDDLSFTFTTASLDEERAKLTYDQLKTIADNLEAYFRRRFTVEVTERTYPSGLAEADDMKVNWFIQACTSSPNAYCQDSNCSNVTWTAPDCNTNVLFNTCSIDTILSHVGLSPDYKTDFFGNPICVNLCYDPTGDGHHGGPPPSHDAVGPFRASVSNGVDTLFAEGE